MWRSKLFDIGICRWMRPLLSSCKNRFFFIRVDVSKIAIKRLERGREGFAADCSLQLWRKMPRMKPAALLQHSKRKKGPAKLSAATLVIVGVVLILLLLSALVVHKQKSKWSDSVIILVFSLPISKCVCRTRLLTFVYNGSKVLAACKIAQVHLVSPVSIL